MSQTAFVLLSAAFLIVPVVVKYTLAFQTRRWVYRLRQRERTVQRLGAQLEAVQSECVVVRRALRQIDLQRRQALGRKAALTERLAWTEAGGVAAKGRKVPAES